MTKPISEIIKASVEKIEGNEWVGGFRTGTVEATYEELEKVFGEPANANFSEEGIDGDGKVHFVYKFNTPRGKVEIRDYWWNAANEQTIGSNGDGSALWLAGYLRRNGFVARANY